MAPSGCLSFENRVELPARHGQGEGPQAARSQTRLGYCRLKKATARREKAEESLKQAQEALEKARLEETGAQEELEDAKAAAVQGPPKMGVTFVGLFFSSCFFSVSSASSKRVLKKNDFYRVFAHPSKSSSNIMQQQ